MSMSQASASIVSEIAINAPVAQVFAAFVEPDRRLQWWTAGGRFRALRGESDLRPGGAWSLHFDSAGHPTSVQGTYRRVEPPHLVEFTWLPTWDPNAVETVVCIELTEHAGVTTVRLTHSGFPSDDARARHRGWPELLDALKRYSEAP